MLNMTIVIRGEVDDETEAHRILAMFDDLAEANPDPELTVTCKATQVITND